ncbi:MAG: helix-turn-helix transcriptional regulator [Gemmatimonadetes bacterium]|uniref:Helix-turn-helix transcriptional regulator n=1 Tax=Candidatus Kutchimonas denitrificans TaxID=3056748 RepID=A0AAE4Z7D6_9BACT|nr:helix-turn-helix transcriptional regulator [Gemmatimonadota bacterium]NIR73822.1 helix-turn-helix transcriptional regulator [Candidatus Kutchimonas denitrificans]NIS00095.1 helix-turn-helix transcriptional regulator [Gemmatimonadota bacterium]NIT65684.1 helix-turn-helix transcriptional regulator [Gemmatimonadota bacterium]NIU53132.1 helix-turn-helix domain-containing protein [Gemmatimonadota bacterium]
MQIVACLPERRARVRLHQAIGSEYTIAMAPDWDELEGLIRTMATDVVVVDPAQKGRAEREPVCRLRQRYPSLPVIIYTEFHTTLAEALLAWGDAGACGAVFLDQTDSAWDLRRIVRLASGRSAAEQILVAIERELGPLDDEVRGILRVGLFEATRLQTVEAWCRVADLPRRRLYRLFRAVGLPTPKRCLQWLRLLHAAKALSDPGVSVEDVLLRMGYSAPSNFWTHVRKILGITPSELRWSVTVDDLAERFARICRERSGSGRRSAADTA